MSVALMLLITEHRKGAIQNNIKSSFLHCVFQVLAGSVALPASLKSEQL